MAYLTEFLRWIVEQLCAGQSFSAQESETNINLAVRKPESIYATCTNLSDMFDDRIRVGCVLYSEDYLFQLLELLVFTVDFIPVRVALTALRSVAGFSLNY